MRRRFDYLRRTGRSAEQVALVEAYMKAQGLFREDNSPALEYSQTLQFDLGSVVPSLAGPKRPQDRVALSDMKQSFQASLVAPVAESRLWARCRQAQPHCHRSKTTAAPSEIGHGSVVIAAITSCTNTSNPSVMVGAGLLAQKAVEKGLDASSRLSKPRWHPARAW